jgi:hypothetical protein
MFLEREKEYFKGLKIECVAQLRFHRDDVTEFKLGGVIDTVELSDLVVLMTLLTL